MNSRNCCAGLSSCDLRGGATIRGKGDFGAGGEVRGSDDEVWGESSSSGADEIFANVLAISCSDIPSQRGVKDLLSSAQSPAFLRDCTDRQT